MTAFADALKKAGIQVTEEVPTHEPKPMKDFEQFQTASRKSPMFLNVVILGKYNGASPRYEGLVACEKKETVTVEENRYYSYQEERVTFRLLQNATHNDLKIGSGLSLCKKEFTITEMLEPTKELMKLYQKTMNNIQCSINCRFMMDGPTTHKDGMDSYNLSGELLTHPLAEVTYHPENVHTLGDAEAWILKNHPEMFFSYAAQNNIGDSCFAAIPSAFAPDGHWETQELRDEWTGEYAAKQNLELGEFHAFVTVNDGIDFEALHQALEQANIAAEYTPEGNLFVLKKDAVQAEAILDELDEYLIEDEKDIELD